MINYISADDIAEIHEEVISTIGGSQGIREAGMLASIAEKPKTSFGDIELYPDVFLKAASIYEALVNYHVFIDGNKRTAALAMYRFLYINGRELTCSNKELETYTLFVATQNPQLYKVAAWIKKHSARAEA